MYNAVSYELMMQKIAAISGNFLGVFADIADLPTAGTTGDYGYVTATSSFWYWNAQLTPPAFANQEIAESDYLDLTDTEKSGMNYLVTPDPVTP